MEKKRAATKQEQKQTDKTNKPSIKVYIAVDDSLLQLQRQERVRRQE